ncbi:helix-turn-helix transcriptional regulator [Maledivibacter halophilus]|uniref:AraC-type DNA-binding protein n=1 Tax=Maledivibacter halophilus TaxID=36842 RepID=A0A1T5L9U8_9FIRM|nr:AraC family transcriptional regulator [Maledivibacter halophilus]SKC72465.1 AraC-type DNA-binding protein [Maledivibacter halophilus]
MKTKFPKVNFHQSQAFDWKNENYNTHELTLIFLQLQHSLKSNKKNSMYYESKIGEILALIIDNHKNGNQKQRQEEKALLSDDIKYLQLVKKELDINFLNPPTMEKLCSISNMGATKLKKSFKINFGTTIYNYLRNVRMKKAIFLLSENELNIYNIAQSVGYKSSSKFSKTFKKIYGMTPSEYRNSLKFNTLPK